MDGFQFPIWIGFLLCLAPATYALLDDDGDGMSDVWERRFQAEALWPGVDTDGDGFVNLEESQSGTDPFDPDSRYQIDFLQRNANALILLSRLPTGTVELVEFSMSPSLDAAAWQPANPTIPLIDQVPEAAAFFRVAHGAIRDADQDGLNDWEEKQLSLNAALPQSVPGTNDLTRARQLLNAPQILTLQADTNLLLETDSTQLRITRTRGLGELVVRLDFGGSLVNATDYEHLPAILVLPFGQNETSLTFQATGRGFPNPNEQATVSIQPHPDYQIVGGAVTLTVEYTESSVFVANLRPETPDYTPAFGKGLLSVDADHSAASLSVELQAFSATPAPTQLWLDDPRAGGVLLESLPGGPQTGLNPNTMPARISDLAAGRLWIRVPSADAPDGELLGQFVLATGEQMLPAPPPPPALPAGLPDEGQASRFLTQATFGPDAASSAEVRALGFDAWIDQQLALAPALHLPLLQTIPNPDQGDRYGVWWQRAVHAPDALRQRMAFALSQIFVVSDRDGTLDLQPEAMAGYYDLLVRGAFGNASDLLKDITLSPVMGVYLSMIGNRKQLPGSSVFPDENYARELMQLFSIGLWQLHPDGTRVTGPDGQPIPTYTQLTIEETARALTGWGWHKTNPADNLIYFPRNFFQPMNMYQAEHDTRAKTVIDGLVLPAGMEGEAELDLLLDALFHHSAMAPFLCRQLIQRLVTGNPSPAYVYRVAQVFADNGQGVRGDLGAVVKAILLDVEARADEPSMHRAFGHLREPILRGTALLRAFAIPPPEGVYDLWDTPALFQQAPLNAESVFNFFRPDYQEGGILQTANLHAPEFEQLGSAAALRIANGVRSGIFDGFFSTQRRVEFDFSSLEALADNPVALTDTLNDLLLAGRMTEGLRNQVENVVAASPVEIPARRVKSALQLIFISPEFVIAK